MSRTLVVPAVLAAAALAGCDHALPASSTRPVEVRGVPRCAAKTQYVRPLVVRLDRERGMFDDPFTADVRIEHPVDVATLSVPRTRMRVIVRLGLCAATSVGTWDCAAATWLSTTTADLDARSTPARIVLPAVDPPCASK